MPESKEGRLQVQRDAIARAVERGATVTEYNGLKFVQTIPTSGQLILTVYKDAAGHPIENRYYRVERVEEAIKGFCTSYDRRAAYKAELKAKGGRHSTQANAAKAIKEELTKAFPGIKFSVTSSGFSMGDDVRVEYSDGPAAKIVEAITDKYEYGHFDGMNDIYVDSNRRQDVPQTKYLFVSRHQSEETRAVIDAWASANDPNGRDNVGYRIFQKTSIPAGRKVIGVKETGKNGSIEDFYELEIEGQAEQIPPAPAVEVSETVPGVVQIIDYSEKAIAVIGDTRPIAAKLSAMHGKFNARLKCGPGWIFSKKRLKEVEEGLSKKEVQAVEAVAEVIREERAGQPFMKLLPPSTAEEVRTEWQQTLNFVQNV